MSFEQDFFSARILKDITVSIPLEIDSDNVGYKNISEDELSKAISYDLKSVLLTHKGERMNTQFGVGIKRYLFEPLTPMLANTIRGEIVKQVSSYMPWLSKFNVIVNTNLELQTLEVIIKYKIDVPNLVDEFNMSLSVSDL